MLKRLERIVKEPVELECVIDGRMCGAFASGHRDITKIGPFEVNVSSPVADKIRFRPENEKTVKSCNHKWKIMGI